MSIAIIGSSNMDLMVTTSRIPESGETVIGSRFETYIGGKGGNQAVAVSRLGAAVEMFGCVGNDEYGKRIMENFKKNNIITKNILVTDNTPTGIALITVDNKDNTIVVVPGANSLLTREYIDLIKEELYKYEVILLQNEIPMETIEYVIQIMKGHDKKIILNPAPARKLSENIISNVDFITPNEHEARIIFGSELSLEELVKKYKGRLIITCGEKGVLTADENGEVIKIPARVVKVVDTTGAGDTFNGALAYCVANKYSQKDSIRFAVAASALSITKFGAQSGMPTIKAVKKLLDT